MFRDAGAADYAQVAALHKDAGWNLELDGFDEGLRFHVPDCTVRVAADDERVHSAVLGAEGQFRYLDRTLRLSAITGVLTASWARRRGYAGRLLAELLEEEQQRGAVVASLGVFDQGFYNRYGFGNMGRDPVLVLNPSAIRVPRKVSGALGAAGTRIVPISHRDDDEVYAAHIRRYTGHGACTIVKRGFIQGFLRYAGEQSFGLGIAVGDRLVAHFFGRRVSEEHVDLFWLCADTQEYYIQLLALLRTLSDQLTQVKIVMPPDVMVYDFLERPLQWGVVHRHSFDDLLFWQLRVLDVVRAVEAVSIPLASPLRFVAEISDPIVAHSPSGWRGCAGEYTMSIGLESRCVRGAEVGLSRVRMSIGAFSRFWSGAASARALACSDEFAAEDALLERLTREYCVPRPRRDCDF